jgi:hypothetical protein
MSRQDVWIRLLASVAILALATAVGCSSGDDPADLGSDSGGDNGGDDVALTFDHTALTDFDDLSAAACEETRQELSFYYGHTSHGSQIMTGLQMLAAENTQYARPDFYEVSDDLGQNGDVSWAQVTRDHLDSHPGVYNVVMWSWCGGVSDNTVAGIDAYLAAMSALETDYPTVRFVYMTGHLDGTGEDGNLRARNDQIRRYCADHDKVLFDFADIESYDPDGTYYPDASDACEWCDDWCAAHGLPLGCGGCAHSHCFNCYQKGKVFWCLMAQLAGA